MPLHGYTRMFENMLEFERAIGQLYEKFFRNYTRKQFFSVLSSERANLLPSLEQGLSSYYQEKKQTALSTTVKAVSK